jgi:hypothetical protein
MIKEIQNIFRLFFILFSGAAITVACESEPDELGMQFFQNGTAQGTEASFDVVAYNVYNNDIVEADNNRLSEATLGAFDESNFGMQKSSYVTQVRLSSYDPDFGANAVVDSVVLQMKPFYQTATDSVVTKTYDDYIHPDNIPAKKVVTSYPIKKYGKAKRNFTINVHEVTDFLYSTETNFYSNQQVNTGALLGTKSFDGYLRAIKITKDSDNSELFSRDAGLRIALDKDFFQSKIINKKGSFELKDVASFIRYFRGLKFSVAEDDGYIFNFNPNELSVIIYYKYDKTENNTTTRTDGSYTLDLGSANVHFNQIQYNRSNTFLNYVSSTPNTNGDTKLFLQGMGGPGAEIVIPDAAIAQLKNLYKNEKIGLLSAKIRLYSDLALWNNSYAKPDTFATLIKTIGTDNSTTFSFFPDKDIFAYSGVYKMVKAVDLDKNPAYYEISITQLVKNIIEKEEANKPISINIGSFQTSSSTGALLGTDYTTKSYTPNRIVLVGSDANNAQYKAQLKVIYSKK